jgi:CDP-4-dehydro-6-deoxyglucose reductase
VNDAPGDHRYVPVLSRAHVDWSGARGYVQHAAIAEHIDFANAIVYACGSDAMIHDAKATLLESGLPKHRFFSDAFVSTASN